MTCTCGHEMHEGRCVAIVSMGIGRRTKPLLCGHLYARAVG